MVDYETTKLNCIADLPGIEFEPSIKVSKPPMPRRRRSSEDLEPYPWREVPLEEAVRHAFEALETPNDTMGYHFHLLDAVAGLWSRRSSGEAVFGLVEELALLDAQIVRVHPAAFQVNRSDGGRQYLRVPSLGTLAKLYSNEGDWESAEEVIALADSIDNTVPRQQTILDNAAAVREEAGDHAR